MNTRTRKLVRAAVIAAVYVALCYLFAWSSYGPIQVRVAEALTLLVVFCPEAVVGVTVGCLLSNLLSFSPIDLVFGTLATLLAALASRRLREKRAFKKPGCPGLALAASLPPVLFNAVIIGAEISLFFAPGAGFAGLLFNMLTVGAGQLVSCTVLGVLLVWVVEKNPALQKLLGATGPSTLRT